MKKFIQNVLIFFVSVSCLSALDLSLRFTPDFMFPLDNHYGLSFGGVVQGDVNLFNMVTVGVEGIGTYATGNNYSENADSSSADAGDITVTPYGAGIGAGIFYYPVSRLYLGAGGSFGVYAFPAKKTIEDDSLSATDKSDKTLQTEDVTVMGLYYRGYGEIGFRINPSVTINALGGYKSYMIINNKPIFQGPFAGVSVKVNFEVGNNKSSGDISANLDQYDNVYPLFTPLYRNDSIGSIVITNYETAEIRNVHVSFRAGKYTSSTIECGSVPIIQKYKTVEVPFLADFSSEILNFSENGQFVGEVIIDYEFLGKKRQSIENVIISVNNRNAYLWGNDDALAAFVSPDTPEVLELAKYISGVERNNLYTGMNRNIQFTAAMFEGLRLSGITYSNDTMTPYKTFHKSENAELDSIQYPLQTMNCLSGDYDDLGILLASCLESVGISTGLMPVDDDFLVLVNLAVKPNQASRHFSSTDGLVIDENNAYFALAMSELENGFTASLIKGSEIVSELKKSEVPVSYVDVEAAWTVYSPIVYTKNEKTFRKPSQSEMEKATKTAISNYINAELVPLIEELKTKGDDNQLGLAYMRAGKYNDAKASFTKAANAGSISGLNNLANILFTEKDYAGAVAQYKKVLAKDPENRTALSGLEKANSKLNQD